MECSDAVKVANRRGRELRASTPRALAVRYDKRANRVVIELSNRLDIAFNPKDAQGLENATGDQLRSVEISPSGFGIRFPKADADIYIPALLEGLLGSRKWMASRLGRQGGRSRSAAKVSAAKENGRLGGRPKKAAAVT
jgi:hypothetical protein